MRAFTWLSNLWFARSGRIGSYAVLALATSLCATTAALVWFGYVATREWRRGTEVLLERRQAEALALVSAALDRDMKGAATSLIIPMDYPTINEEPPSDLRLLTAEVFARFPYPDSLIIWRDTPAPDGTSYSFDRAERTPPWDHSEQDKEPFPVTLQRNNPMLRPVVEQLRHAYQRGQPFAVIDLSIAGAPYQLVVHYLTDPDPPFAMSAFAALAIGVSWVKREYFAPVLHQAATIGGNVDVLSLAVHDENDNVLATTGPRQVGAGDSAKTFPALFIDPALLSQAQRQRQNFASWKVHVRPTRDGAFTAASAGSQRSFALIAIAAGLSIGALLVTIRAVEAKSALTAMKSDFVAAVTHDLKTPVAIVRLVGDTLAGGRYAPSAITEYATVLSRESGRLAKSIDQLLTYARYSQAQKPDDLHLSMLKLDELIETEIDNLRPALAAAHCEVQMDIPRSLPAVRVDRTAIVQVVENIVDNALKYSTDAPRLRIFGAADRGIVTLTFADNGIGIPREDLDHVFERFYRARNAKGSGSGLGLTIAKRILEYHGGHIRVRSTLAGGTEVSLAFPVAGPA